MTRLGKYFAVRVGGLPYDTVDGLRCDDATGCAAEILELESELVTAAGPVGDLLHDLIGATDDSGARRQLLALRRQVFQGKLPGDPSGALAALPSDAAVSVRGWIAARQRIADRQRELGGLLDAELARTRAELWRLSGDPRLRAGIQIASPPLDEQLLSFARGDGATPPAKKLRRVERSVLSYLYRTACKTSPFSWFTGIGVGQFDGATDIDDERSFVRLNVVALTRIVEAICADTGRRGDLPVVLSPGLRQDPGRVRYVRRWVTQGDDRAPVSFDSIKDGLFYLRRSGLLDRLTALLQGGGAWRCADLADWLRRETDADPSKCDEYLSVLLRLGILQLDGFATDVHSPDPLRHLRDFLTTLGRPWADGLVETLAEPIALVDEFRDGDLGVRRTALRRLRETLGDLLAGLGADGVSPPKALLYEDCRIPAPAAPFGRNAGNVAAVESDLAAVEAVLPAFDLTLPHRIMFHGFFLARYGTGGRCDDLLRLVEDFHEDLYDQYLISTADLNPFADDGSYRPEENWLGRPELSTLDKVRQEFADYMAARGAACDTDEITLDPAALHEIGRGLKDLFGGFRPQSHLVQAAGELVVLNQSLGGVAFPFSRFTHCFDDDLTGRLKAHAAEKAPPGAVFAEVTGGPVTTNLNLHAQLTDHVVVCPGETSLAPEESQLPLSDLYLEHDAAADRVVLRSTRLDREVIPVYLGYLVPMALPQLHRTLLLLSPTSLATFDVWRGVPERRKRPRVRIGDVVVSRRSWTMPATALPRRGDDDTDAAWFLGWQRWRREHGLPEKTFATVHSGVGRPKPQYVDCASYLSLLAVEALVNNDDDRVVFREMLPSGDDLDDGHVTEFVIETFPGTGEGNG